MPDRVIAYNSEQLHKYATEVPACTKRNRRQVAVATPRATPEVQMEPCRWVGLETNGETATETSWHFCRDTETASAIDSSGRIL
jgi:hypothetical protein